MTAGWMLPRDWDAGRLLRFLTGLALIALAFAANAGLIATPDVPAPAAPATVTTTTVDVPAADAPAAPAEAPADRPMITVTVIEIGFLRVDPAESVDPADVTPGTYGSRAPPAL